MSTKEEILKRLDEYYKKRRNNPNHQLSKPDEAETVLLLAELTFLDCDKNKELAEQFKKFSAPIIRQYFVKLVAFKECNVQILDNALEMLLLAGKSKQYSAAIEVVMKNRAMALQCESLPMIVAATASIALKNKDGMKAFKSEINNTSGGIFLLDYSKLSKENQKTIWDAILLIYPDLSECEYKKAISEWAYRYGFLDQSKPQSIQKESEQEQSKGNERPQEDKEKTPVNNAPDKSENEINKALEDQCKAIMTVLEKKLAPLDEATKALKNEALSFEKLSAENASLNLTLREKDMIIEKQTNEIVEYQKELYVSKSEQSQLQQQVSELENKITVLDEKLSQAYAIGSREVAMAEEKIRMSLHKDFMYLHEDWQEYEMSECSEENYESLQVIIKKVFRTLKRNGISFEGENK